MHSGIFAAELERLHGEASHEGYDETPRRKAYLTEWFASEKQRFGDRLKWFENALGPVELLGSCVVSFLLLSLPILTQFASLAKD
ncbi:MAG: hypothetical protein EOP10_33955 [Proteobacteria bacterium]|nr:MAG: hypothetical protein EOP10_33955 [Pseudomonadota bacterium]